MRTLIDIQDELVEDLLRETRAKTKKEAIVTAIEFYLSQKRREALASLIGNYDFGYNLEELEEMRKDD
jgi:Arc/MetJ family transcription regulator